MEPGLLALKQFLLSNVCNTLTPVTRNWVERQASSCKVVNGVIFKDVSHNPSKEDFKVFVPPSLQRRVIEIHHVVPSAGHLGFKKTRANIFRSYTWPSATQQIQKFLRNCTSCQICKATTIKTAGLMQTRMLS